MAWAKSLTEGYGVDSLLDCLPPGAPAAAMMRALYTLRRGGRAANVGAERWVGRQAHVLEAIPAHGTGVVRLDREQWRAESGTDTDIPAGSAVLVTRLDGTRLEVVPLELAPPPSQPEEQT
jgi:membrane protein implicated in regulation of membrane protease activity